MEDIDWASVEASLFSGLNDLCFRSRCCFFCFAPRPVFLEPAEFWPPAGCSLRPSTALAEDGLVAELLPWEVEVVVLETSLGCLEASRPMRPRLGLLEVVLLLVVASGGRSTNN